MRVGEIGGGSAIPVIMKQSQNDAKQMVRQTTLTAERDKAQGGQAIQAMLSRNVT